MLASLMRLLPRIAQELEAKLSGVNGYTGYGEIELTFWHSGTREMEVELRGVAGRQAEIHLNGSQAVTVDLSNGRVDKYFDTRNGDNVPELTIGDRVQVRQNGDIILEGILELDR